MVQKLGAEYHKFGVPTGGKLCLEVVCEIEVEAGTFVWVKAVCKHVDEIGPWMKFIMEKFKLELNF
jgi:hypothetical protein